MEKDVRILPGSSGSGTSENDKGEDSSLSINIESLLRGRSISEASFNARWFLNVILIYLNEIANK